MEQSHEDQWGIRSSREMLIKIAVKVSVPAKLATSTFAHVHPISSFASHLGRSLHWALGACEMRGHLQVGIRSWIRESGRTPANTSSTPEDPLGQVRVVLVNTRTGTGREICRNLLNLETILGNLLKKVLLNELDMLTGEPKWRTMICHQDEFQEYFFLP